MTLYIQADNISGDVTTKPYKGQIEIDSFSLDLSRSVPMLTGNANNCSIGAPSFGKVLITKKPCSASGPLLNIYTRGKVIPQITLTCCHTDKNLAIHRQYVFHDSMISHIKYLEQGSSSYDRREHYMLSYTYLEILDTPHNKANKPTKPFTAGYNLSTNEPL